MWYSDSGKHSHLFPWSSCSIVAVIETTCILFCIGTVCAKDGTGGICTIATVMYQREYITVAMIQIPSQPPTALDSWKSSSLSLTEEHICITIILIYAKKQICAPSRCCVWQKKISSSLLCKKVVIPVFHCTSSSWPSISNCHSYKHFGSCHFQLRAVRMLVKLANQCQERLGWNDSAHTFFSVLCKTTSVLGNWTY